jgi:hypothetical protein
MVWGNLVVVLHGWVLRNHNRQSNRTSENKQLGWESVGLDSNVSPDNAKVQLQNS